MTLRTYSGNANTDGCELLCINYFLTGCYVDSDKKPVISKSPTAISISEPLTTGSHRAMALVLHLALNQPLACGGKIGENVPGYEANMYL